MAQKPLRPCSKPGCNALTNDRYCEAHRALRNARQESAQWQAWYKKQIWVNDLRPAQLLREPFCRHCQAVGVRRRATVVDHVVPHRGDWALFVNKQNHQSLCKTCHDRKTALEQAERRRK